jgi:hypothetical protein
MLSSKSVRSFGGLPAVLSDGKTAFWPILAFTALLRLSTAVRVYREAIEKRKMEEWTIQQRNVP